MANADPARSRRYQKNQKIDCDSAIVTRISSIHQYFLIRHHRLTEVLEALETVGITGDLAIFILANIQTLEVGA